MRARLRRALTYANVVSTLSLFIVLGGSAYASGLIDGSHLRAHSVSGSKIKANSLTGAQIRESTLQRVPNAARLGGHAASDFLGASDQATDSAALGGRDASSFLGVSDQAADSALLGGRDASSFLSADRVVTGAGNLTSPGQDPIVAYAPLSLTVSTDGTADHALTVELVNTGAGALTLTRSDAGTPLSVPPESTVPVTLAAGTTAATFVVHSVADPTQALDVSCGFDAPQGVVDCAGIGIG